MNTYYFNNSDWTFKKEINVITEARFRKIQDNCLVGWDSHWLSFEANNLTEATEHIKSTWCK